MCPPGQKSGEEEGSAFSGDSVLLEEEEAEIRPSRQVRRVCVVGFGVGAMLVTLSGLDGVSRAMVSHWRILIRIGESPNPVCKPPRQHQGTHFSKDLNQGSGRLKHLSDDMLQVGYSINRTAHFWVPFSIEYHVYKRLPFLYGALESAKQTKETAGTYVPKYKKKIWGLTY